MRIHRRSALNLLAAPEFIADDILIAGRTGKFEFSHKRRLKILPAGGHARAANSFRGYLEHPPGRASRQCGSPDSAYRRMEASGPPSHLLSAGVLAAAVASAWGLACGGLGL